MPPSAMPDDSLKLPDIRMRDVCILPDPTTQTYYAITSMVGPRPATPRPPRVEVLSSKDLVNWSAPATVFEIPPSFWGDTPIRGIWAPEMHRYDGRYYLFITIDTTEFLSEQWRDWLPRVKRGSQVLVGDSPMGPFKPFATNATLPADMMTLDGTLFIENDVPYMVYCHEWVQIKDGTVEAIELSRNLSQTVGEPFRLFHGSDAPWAIKSEEHGCYVTDGPSFHRSHSGKLFMIWSGFRSGSYTTGVAISDTGQLRGPWRQHADPLYTDDGGHGCLFTRFDGQLMMVLHSPNQPGQERAKLFELKDTGETLQILRPF